MKKTKLKIALSTVLVIFNLVFCFVATFAWFVGQANNDASGLGVKMQTYDLDIEYYKIFKYSDDTKCGIDVTDDPNGSFELPYFDTVIRSRNEHTAVILLFCISGQEIGSTSIRATMTCNEENNTPYDNDPDKEFLSNAVRFKLAPISTATIPPIAATNNVPTAAEAASIYDKAITYFDDNGVEIAFSNWTQKRTTITHTFAPSDYSDFVVGNKVYLYMLFDYSEDLVNKLVIDSSPTKLSPGGEVVGDLVNLKLAAIAE